MGVSILVLLMSIVDNMIFDIKRHLLTPQLNGLAERMNRTLVERVRCLLS